MRAVALAGLGLIFALSLANHVRWIDGSLPYPQHVDERFIAVPALRILQTGDLDPGFFRYPSLPIYLASLGMGVGALFSQADAAEILRVEYPYYSHPMVMRVPRIVHAAFASGTLLLVGAIGYRIRRTHSVLVLGPAVLALSAYYQKEAWQYLNVDMIASFFALAATLQILRGADAPSFRSLVAWPALLCGATAASKYPSGLILVPAVLAAFWYAPHERRVRWVGALIVGTAAAFVLFCPYSLLSFDAFVNGLLFEIRHYASGRALHEADPGPPQMAFYGDFIVRQFGIGILALAGVGWVAALRRDWRRGVLLGLFPIAIFLLLSSQRVHFHRNLIPAYGMLAVATALGIHTLSSWFAGSRAFLKRPKLGGFIGACAALLAVLSTFPVASLQSLRAGIDSRNQATAWLRSNLQGGGTVVIPSFAPFSARGLPIEVVRVLRPERREPVSLALKRDCYVVAPGLHTADDWRADWLTRHALPDPAAEFGGARLGQHGYFGKRLQIRLLPCR